MSPYVYRGTKHDLNEPLPPTQPVETQGPELAKCGTYAGSKRHRRAGETPCDPCKAAAAEYMLNWRRNHPRTTTERIAGTYTPGICGTHNGYERHRRANTTPCQPCRTGHAQYSAKRKAIREQQAAERRSAA